MRALLSVANRDGITPLARDLAALDVEMLLDTLGPKRGMLYYHLLLGRLERRGNLPPLP